MGEFGTAYGRDEQALAVVHPRREDTLGGGMAYNGYVNSTPRAEGVEAAFGSPGPCYVPGRRRAAMGASLIRGRYVVSGNADGDPAGVIEDGAVYQRDGTIVDVGPQAS